jgi:hypothetical protein
MANFTQLQNSTDLSYAVWTCLSVLHNIKLQGCEYASVGCEEIPGEKAWSCRRVRGNNIFSTLYVGQLNYIHVLCS